MELKEKNESKKDCRECGYSKMIENSDGCTYRKCTIGINNCIYVQKYNQFHDVCKKCKLYPCAEYPCELIKPLLRDRELDIDERTQLRGLVAVCGEFFTNFISLQYDLLKSQITILTLRKKNTKAVKIYESALSEVFAKIQKTKQDIALELRQWVENGEVDELWDMIYKLEGRL